MHIKLRSNHPRNIQGFTLAEVAVALAIAALLLASIILGFTESAQMAEWSAYNQAAQALAMQGIEQARSTTWDPQAPTPVDNCTQAAFPVKTYTLDVPETLTNNATIATNTWTITTISNSTYPLKSIRVDTTWRYVRTTGSKVFTNSIATLRSPNQ